MSIYLFVDSVNKTKKEIPVLGFLKKNVYDSNVVRPYMVLSGINTGYGFYGINVATNKFFLIEVLDKENCLVEKINVSNFKTKNSFQRFHTLPSWLYNFKVETKDLRKELDTVTKNDIKYFDLREEYVEKVFKHILKSYVKDIERDEENTYAIKLITVVPPDIWKSELEKNNIYVLTEYNFNEEQIFE